MTKRRKFVVTSLLLSIGFSVIQFLPENLRFISIGILGLLTLLLFIWSVYEGLGFDMTLASLILPVFFTVGVGLFWFLLPSNIYARIPIIILYGIGIYALCLTANIYTVAAIRTIALLRAARGVGFVLSLLTFFLVFDTVLSLRWPIYLSFFLVFLVSIPLYLQSYWSVDLDKKLSLSIFILSLVASLVTGEMATALFFWPTSTAVGSLFLTVSSYALMGLGQAKVEGRLFVQTVREYMAIYIIVFIGMFFATSWSG
jgi:hypothetical protein